MESCIVIKVTREYIVLLKPDGTFKNVRRTGAEIPLIGEKYIVNEKLRSTLFPRLIAATAVACILLLTVLSYGMFMKKGNSQKSYFVALDINPSIEIYTDKELITTQITALNEDGTKLSGSTEYKGKSLYDTLKLLVEQSIIKGYLKHEGEEYIKITFVSFNKAKEIDENKIKESINKLLSGNDVSAELEMGFETKNIIEEAHRTGLSVNRYILYKKLVNAGVSITVEDSKNIPLEELKYYENRQKKSTPTQSATPKGNDKNEPSGIPDNNKEPENRSGNPPKSIQNSKAPEGNNHNTQKNIPDKTYTAGNADKKDNKEPKGNINPKITPNNKADPSSTVNENVNNGYSEGKPENVNTDNSSMEDKSENVSTDNSSIEGKSGNGGTNNDSMEEYLNNGSAGNSSTENSNSGNTDSPYDNENLQTKRSSDSQSTPLNQNLNEDDNEAVNVGRPSTTSNKVVQPSGQKSDSPNDNEKN